EFLTGSFVRSPVDRVKKYLSFCHWGLPFSAAGLRYAMSDRKNQVIAICMSALRLRTTSQLEWPLLAAGGCRRAMTSGLAQTPRRAAPRCSDAPMPYMQRTAWCRKLHRFRKENFERL